MPKNLKIWQFDPAQLSAYYNIATCQALARAGCQVRYIASRFLYDDELPLTADFHTDYLYFRGLDHPRLLEMPRLRRVLRALDYPLSHLRLLRLADRERPDIVHFQWSRLPYFDLRLMQHLQQMGIPVVHTVHDVVPLFASEASAGALKAIYNRADRLIVHTQANVTDFLKVYPDVPTHKLRVIPHLEIANQDAPPGVSKASARARLGLPADAPLFLFFGSIRHYKGVDLLLEAFAHARQSRPELHLLIAGRADPLERAKLPALEALHEQPNIHLHQKFIPHGHLWMYYTAADVVVYPYRHIYQSGALITGMGFGRAVIVTDVGGMPETLDGNGWVVPAGDIPALAQAMLEAAADLPRLEIMGARSLEIIKTRHSGASVAAQLIALYQEALKS